MTTFNPDNPHPPYNTVFALTILKNALQQLDERCVRDIEADEERCRRYAETSPSLATALNAYVGYAVAAEVVKQSLRECRSIIDVVRERGLLTEDQIKEVFDPIKMTEPGITSPFSSTEALALRDSHVAPEGGRNTSLPVGGEGGSVFQDGISSYGRRLDKKFYDA